MKFHNLGALWVEDKYGKWKQMMQMSSQKKIIIDLSVLGKLPLEEEDERNKERKKERKIHKCI